MGLFSPNWAGKTRYGTFSSKTTARLSLTKDEGEYKKSVEKKRSNF